MKKEFMITGRGRGGKAMRVVCSQVGIEPGVNCKLCMMHNRCHAFKDWNRFKKDKIPDDFQPDPEANVFRETFKSNKRRRRRKMIIPKYYCPHCRKFKKWYQVQMRGLGMLYPNCRHCDTKVVYTEDILKDFAFAHIGRKEHSDEV